MRPSRIRRALDGVVDGAPVWLGAAGVVLTFLFAVRLLGTATEALSPVIRTVLARVVVGDLPALGVAWLGSYALGNGSVVAALSLSLFAADLLTPSQLFMMVVGSRLGAAAIVVFVGVLDYVQRGPLSLTDALRLGLLAFVLTYTVYLPVTVVGYVAAPWLRPLFPVVGAAGVSVRPFDALSPAVAGLTDRLGAVAVFVLAVALVLASLKLFDRVFDRVDEDWLRATVFARFENHWLSFVAGLLVSGATTSVAFSLGVVVPLYNRDYLDRAAVCPYVLGSNVGTLVDTLVVAVVLGSRVGAATVGLVVVLALAATVAALLLYQPYFDAVTAVHDRVLASRRATALAVAVLVLVPLALVAVR
jgi:sodium-dependent phosphate cotransporter